MIDCADSQRRFEHDSSAWTKRIAVSKPVSNWRIKEIGVVNLTQIASLGGLDWCEWKKASCHLRQESTEIRPLRGVGYALILPSSRDKEQRPSRSFRESEPMVELYLP